MHFMYAAVVCSQLSQVISEMYIFNWMPTIRTLFVKVNSVRTCGYSSKPKRVGAETSLENTGLCYSGPISCYHV